MSNDSSTTDGARIFIVDDEVNMGKILTKFFTMEGHDVTAFSRSTEALQEILANPPDLIISDMRMPEMTGEEMLEKITENKIPTRVIVMTAHATIENAIACTKMGAFDYITKPFDTNKLVELVTQALTRPPMFAEKVISKRQEPIPAKAQTPAAKSSSDAPKKLSRNMIGKSASFEKAKKLIERVAPSESPVLIMGESGTGKEVAARALHDLSDRNEANFVAINCASIPENLIESELFGHAKGSFTGAHQLKIGLIEMAHHGTLFLDEIGELPLHLQAKLLRVLQEREITRIGETGTVSVDIRIVSATNRDLKECVKQKTFREDLYYRLNVISIKLPSLRERLDDIPELANYFLKIKGAKEGRELEFTPDAIEDLKSKKWSGNIRELENFIERVVIMSEADLIDVYDFPTDYASANEMSIDGIEKLARSAESLVSKQTDFKEARDIFERQYLEAALRASKFNVSEAAKKANMSRRNMYEKIEKLGIDIDAIKHETD